MVRDMGLVIDAEMHEDSDVEIIQGATARRGEQRRRLARNDEQPEDIADSAEEEDEDFDDQDKSQSSVNSD